MVYGYRNEFNNVFIIPLLEKVEQNQTRDFKILLNKILNIIFR